MRDRENREAERDSLTVTAGQRDRARGGLGERERATLESERQRGEFLTSFRCSESDIE